MLTKKFSNLIKEIEQLKNNEQDNLVDLINDELKWTKSFANSQDLLAELADEALKEHKEGETLDMD
jgi:hypothetical protein